LRLLLHSVSHESNIMVGKMMGTELGIPVIGSLGTQRGDGREKPEQEAICN
jgi:hypothetical protein